MIPELYYIYSYHNKLKIKLSKEEKEHIKFNIKKCIDEHKDEFEQELDFKDWRNSIGAMILLPNGTNQSFSSDKYEDKIKHYQSFCEHINQ